MQRIEKTLRIEIPTSADVSGFSDDLDRIRQQQQRDPVDVPVKPAQLDNFARQIKAEAERLARTVELSIPVTADGEQMRRKITAQVAGLSRLLEVKVPMDVGNAAAFRAQVLAQLAEVEALAKAADPTVKLRVDVNKSQLREIENVGGRLAGLQRIASDAARGIGGVFDEVGKGASGALAGVGPLVAKLPLIPTALALAAPLAADLAVSLGPSLVAGLSAVTGVGVAVGVLALGMGKLQAAFKPVLDGFDGMKAKIGDVLAQGVRPLATEFAARALPVIQQGLAGVARVLNGVVRDVVKWASSSDTLMLLGDMFRALSQALRPLSSAVVSILDAIARLATAGMPAFQHLNEVIAGLAKRFDGFIKSKEKDGSLPKTINDSMDAALHLIGALVNLGRAVGGLFADIGKGSTSSLTDGIQAIADAIDRFNQGGGGKKIRDFLVQVGQAIGRYFTSGQFTQTADDLSQFAHDAADAVGPVASLVRAVRSLGDGLKGIPGGSAALSGAAQALDPVLTGIQAMEGLKVQIPQTWASITTATSTAWAAVTGFVASAWATITSTVSSATASTVAAVTGAWGSVVAFFAGVWAGITSAVSTGWAAVVAAVSTAAGAVTAAFQAVVGVVSSIWSAFWNNSFVQLVAASFALVQSIINLAGAVIVAAVKGTVDAAVLYWQVGWAQVQAVTGALVAFVQGAWTTISSATSTAWQAIAGFVGSAASAVAGFVSSAWGRVTSVTSTAWAAVSSTVSEWWNTIAGTTNAKGSQIAASVASWFSRVASSITGAFRDGYNGAVTWIGNLMGEVAGLGGRILTAVAGFGTMLFSAGAQLIQGLIDGITSKIQAVTGAVNGIAAKIRGFFPGSPVKEGPLTSWNNGGAGRRLVDLLVTGLSDTSGVESAMTTLAGKVAAPIEASVFASAQDAGGGLTAGGVVVNVTNPVPETASESITRIMRRLAVFGPAALPATA